MDHAEGPASGADAQLQDGLDLAVVDRPIDGAIMGWFGKMEKIEQPPTARLGHRCPP
jgi:hypothetical protein